MNAFHLSLAGVLALLLLLALLCTLRWIGRRRGTFNLSLGLPGVWFRASAKIESDDLPRTRRK